MDPRIEEKYTIHCGMSSDINEHLPTLYEYAKLCSHITECGTRDVVSSYAFARGLAGRSGARLILVDPYKSDTLDTFCEMCENSGISTTYYQESDLECPLENTELLFIDTWHIYGQLKRELERWQGYVSRYIVLHDTTVDAELGESLRMGHTIEEKIFQSGFEPEEITRGLWPAVEEFIAAHPEWKIKHRYTNNNGLTILERQVELPESC